MPAGHPTPLSVAIFFPALCSFFSHAREHCALAATRKASWRLPPHKSIHSLTVGGTVTGCAPMKKFVSLLLCLSLSLFIVARATKPAHTPAPDTKTAQSKPNGQEADAKTLLNDANTDEEVASADGDSMEVGSNDEGEDMNDD